MKLIEAIRSFRKSGNNRRLLEKELIKSCLSICKAINSEEDDSLKQSMAYFELISDQIRGKLVWNTDIYNRKHKLENLHLYDRP